MLKASWICFVVSAVRLLAIEVPAGTELHVRLAERVSTSLSKPKEPLKALLIAPVVQDGQIVIPAGAELTGSVKAVQSLAQANKERASLFLDFTGLRIADEKTKLSAKVAGVDNARETVDETGKILGIVAGETLAGRIDQGIRKVAGRYAGLADVLKATKDVAGVKEAEGDISYEPGVELTLQLTKPLQIKTPFEGETAQLEPFPSEAEVIEMVTAQPFRTLASNPSRPSDITNLMFLGTQEQLESAFAAAGWSTAAALNRQSKMETVRAVIEERGYKEAPVSTLLLDGNPPDLVFQKQNNTFAQRHHLRIWRRPGDFDGLPIWVCSATHDTGIDFSQQDHTFIHRIDPRIDNERAKVINDLLLTHQVKSLTMVDRAEVPRQAQNATGDNMETDGRMAVLMFQPSAAPFLNQ